MWASLQKETRGEKVKRTAKHLHAKCFGFPPAKQRQPHHCNAQRLPFPALPCRFLTLVSRNKAYK
jgi:hypothetical protein